MAAVAQGPMKRGIPYHWISAGGAPDAKLVAAGQRDLLKVIIGNVNAAARYVHFYDTAVAPVAGAGTPVLTLMVPGGVTGVNATADLAMHPDLGATFVNGLGFTITALPADTDATTPSAGDVNLSLTYR